MVAGFLEHPLPGAREDAQDLEEVAVVDVVLVDAHLEIGAVAAARETIDVGLEVGDLWKALVPH